MFCSRCQYRHVCRDEWDASCCVQDPQEVDLTEDGMVQEACATTSKARRAASATSAAAKPPGRRKLKVLEIFSWAMVLSTLALSREGWTAGPVCSIETGFDLTTADGQCKAWQLLENEDPDVVTVAWPCTDWSLMQNLNLGRPDYWRRLLKRRKKSIKMVKFSADVAEWQNKRHRPTRPKFFLAENPWNS